MSATAKKEYTLETLNDFIGLELGTSEWFTIDQKQIDQFAEVTGDNQWIHVDPVRAKKESPYKTTIAHGFYSLSMIPMLQFKLGLVPKGVLQAVNYGLNKVRFVQPVPVDSRLRLRVVLLFADDKGGGRILLTTKNTMEIEGQERPAFVAESLAMLYTKAA